MMYKRWSLGKLFFPGERRERPVERALFPALGMLLCEMEAWCYSSFLPPWGKDEQNHRVSHPALWPPWAPDQIEEVFLCTVWHQFSSVQYSRSVVFSSLQPRELQHGRPPCPSPTPGFHPNSCPSSRWCHPAISSSVVPFSSCPQSLPASESFLMSQLFAWGGQSTGVSALASFLPKNTQDWSRLEWTGWISLQSKGLSRVFSNTTVQKHQFFGTQLSLESYSISIHDYWKNHSLD